MSVKINVVTLLTHPKRRASVQSKGQSKGKGEGGAQKVPATW